jgi:hypothetical protein
MALADRTPLAQSEVYRMIYRRALAAGHRTKLGGLHNTRVTGFWCFPIASLIKPLQPNGQTLAQFNTGKEALQR